MTNIVKNYYDENVENEWRRLEDPYARIEFFSTLYMIKKYFPKQGTIFDIGSGPGKYSIELLKRGYKVSLMDLSEKSILFAKEKIESLDLKCEKYICGDANYLNGEVDNTYDGILLMGPMYHIHSKDKRIGILNECKRLLKPNGVILISYINSWGALRVGISEFAQEFEQINNIYKLFNEQQFTEDESFTEAYFTTPPIALEEVKKSGLEVISYAGAESFLSGQGMYMTKHYLENKKIYLNLLKVATEKCEQHQYRDSTEHLLIVAKKK
ncbi:MAG: class I SAM-dependent methyltransferase [Sarcina sp.]